METRERLSARTCAFLKNLPPEFALRVIATDYPHIANRMVLSWPDAAAFIALINGLVSSESVSREGFPLLALVELIALRDYRARQRD